MAEDLNTIKKSEDRKHVYVWRINKDISTYVYACLTVATLLRQANLINLKTAPWKHTLQRLQNTPTRQQF